MSTVGLTVCPEITGRVRPPRSLSLPFAFGYPLGAPDDPTLQRRVLRDALALLAHPGPPPVMAEGTG